MLAVADNRRRKWLRAATAVLAVAIGSPLTVRATDMELSDSLITFALERELRSNPAVPANFIDIQTKDGIVTLSGSVPSLLARERAVDEAGTLRGVRAVVNRIEVRAPDRSDDALRDDVRRALDTDPATDVFEIDVAVDGQVVTLNGEVESWGEKRLCAEVASSVRGVKEIHNEIRVGYDARRNDAAIRAEIEGVLAADAWVDEERIHVEVKDGTAILEGKVGSVKEKTRAVGDAWVAGVTEVDSAGLELDWVSPDDAMTRETRRIELTDNQVEQAVSAALRQDPRIKDSGKVRVTAIEGAVTLSGSVGSLRARQAAEQDARNTTGVWRVTNYLKVRPDERRGRESLADDVNWALTRSPYLDRFEVRVEVHDGTVKLYGAVDEPFEREEAARVASNVKGVIEVNNHITVRTFSGGGKSDRELLEDIRSELWWSPYVDSDAVNVEVEDGVARLTGRLDSWQACVAAERNAYEAGALKVKNMLACGP